MVAVVLAADSTGAVRFWSDESVFADRRRLNAIDEPDEIATAAIETDDAAGVTAAGSDAVVSDAAGPDAVVPDAVGSDAVVPDERLDASAAVRRFRS